MTNATSTRPVLLTAFLVQALLLAPSASAKLRKPEKNKRSLQKKKPEHIVPPPFPGGLGNGKKLPPPHVPPPPLGGGARNDLPHPVGPAAAIMETYETGAPPETRIVGGVPVSGPEVYPFYVNWFDACGGSLIHPDIVLTAAHCNPIPAGSTVTVDGFKLGDSSTTGAEVRNILERAPHPGYNSATFANDFMLLHLDSPVTTVQPIPLNDVGTVPFEGQDLTVIGLGTTTEGGNQADVLQEVIVQTVSDAECNVNYGGDIVEDVMFCAGVDGGGKDSCQGDSGGPIFTLNPDGSVDKQVGVVSWGFGCARPGLPGVYAEISAVNDWIFAEICRLSSDKPVGCPEPTPAPTMAPPGPGEAQVEVKIVADRFPAEISWSLTDDTGTVLASVAPGTYAIEEQTYGETLNLKTGIPHTFTIEDAYADGICCSYGEGMWEIRANGLLLASGAEYGAFQTEVFVVPGSDQISTSPPTPPPTPDSTIPSTPPPTPDSTIPSTPIPTGGGTTRDCDDTTDTIFVDADAGTQDCAWLSTNIVRYGYLCQFVDVAIVCPGTCDSCSIFG